MQVPDVDFDETIDARLHQRRETGNGDHANHALPASAHDVGHRMDIETSTRPQFPLLSTKLLTLARRSPPR